jgi:hypothetical protein
MAFDSGPGPLTAGCGVFLGFLRRGLLVWVWFVVWGGQEQEEAPQRQRLLRDEGLPTSDLELGGDL